MTENDFEAILRYHERTKHHRNRYARSPGYMDWENQPDPFRSYGGCQTVDLPLLEQDTAAGHLSLYRHGATQPGAFTPANIGAWLERSMGLSAWKAAGQSSWSLRMNPSSGNLHPTETHLVLYDPEGFGPGIYHYNPLSHGLALRAELPDGIRRKLRRHFESGGGLVALTSIFWRESWKYGERAYRYCNLDAGHAVAGLALSAGLMGWQMTLLNALSDSQIETLLGFDKTDWLPLEAEHPDLVCLVHPVTRTRVPRHIPPDILADFSRLPYAGTPNRLSGERMDWKIIYETAGRSRKPETPDRMVDLDSPAFFPGPESTLTAARIIRNRRSATAYDREGAVEKTAFFSILDKTLPRNGSPPFDVQLDAPRVHLLLFVHNVDGLRQGLYFFCRNKADMADIRRHTRPEFAWEPATEGLPLYFLAADDYRFDAIAVSCNQDIAGFGAFSAGMIANFRRTIENEPFRYRHLYWECGMIGQILYLESEAQGVRGTGIGCFFDDDVHDILGLTDQTYQSLYHFTVGVPVEDPRLTVHPPYIHLKRR